jgi:hypothetical protein
MHSDVQVAFVGGYRPYKNLQYDRYLKPYEAKLRVYGYNSWPYSGYRGLLPNNEERLLYQNAGVSPALSEPHAELVGDICERVYKIMGSGGLAITDVTPSYREVFDRDELLVPDSVADYHELVRRALDDDDFNLQFRRRGLKAIEERHTYAHRARQIVGLLGLESPLVSR